MLIGVCLLVVATIALVCWQWGIHTSEEKTASYVHTIRTLIPEPQGAALEEKRDNTMAVLSIAGTDFVGILEMTRYGSAVPVCASWGEVAKYPAVSVVVFTTAPYKLAAPPKKDSTIFTGRSLWEIPYSSRIWKETASRMW